MSLAFRWSLAGDIPALVRFFVDNVDTDYISHGEILDGRALDPDRWSPALADVLTDEFSGCRFDARPVDDGKRLALAERGRALAALALFERVGEHAWLHDLVVARDERGQRIGARLLAWIEAEAQAGGVVDLFLESGNANGDAHRFFERAGYRPMSVVMRKRIGQTR